MQIQRCVKVSASPLWLGVPGKDNNVLEPRIMLTKVAINLCLFLFVAIRCVATFGAHTQKCSFCPSEIKLASYGCPCRLKGKGLFRMFYMLLNVEQRNDHYRRAMSYKWSNLSSVRSDYTMETPMQMPAYFDSPTEECKIFFRVLHQTSETG